MNLVTQPPLRPDAHDVTDQEHADRQFGIDRWATDIAVEWTKVLANVGQIDEPINRPKQMIVGYVALK